LYHTYLLALIQWPAGILDYDFAICGGQEEKVGGQTLLVTGLSLSSVQRLILEKKFLRSMHFLAHGICCDFEEMSKADYKQ